MKLNIPYHKQEETYTCAVATLRTIFDFFKVPNNREILMSDLEPDKNSGVPHHKLIEAIKNAGLFAYVNNDSIVDEIKYYLEGGYPVIVNYLNPADNDGHYSVVIGFEDNDLIMNDPWNGEGFKITFKDFEDRWRSGDGKNFRWLMAVSTKEFNLGKQYRPDSSI